MKNWKNFVVAAALGMSVGVAPSYAEKDKGRGDISRGGRGGDQNRDKDKDKNKDRDKDHNRDKNRDKDKKHEREAREREWQRRHDWERERDNRRRERDWDRQHGRWDNRRSDPWEQPWRPEPRPRIPGDDTTVVQCNAQDQQTNVARVDRAVVRLENNPQLAGANRFHTQVKQISKMDTRDKAEAYLGLAGVKDPRDNRAVVKTLDPKADHSANIEALQKNLNLDDDQAKLVFEEVQKALRGQNI